MGVVKVFQDDFVLVLIVEEDYQLLGWHITTLRRENRVRTNSGDGEEIIVNKSFLDVISRCQQGSLRVCYS